ncbi:uncharacterized protein ARMOST_08595 [Armillaria ostoyae]|uniref:RRM domain-containing protein n=1 Tax=Armillaria ostoyae TaxID=47428 RepID=A0A284R957_ARMOS|nr:uncharacterized protein ARMOST_08595 [Armillaria ostoyae]
MHNYCTWCICLMHNLLQNLPESIMKEQLIVLFFQYPNLHKVCLVPSKKDIAFMEYLDKESLDIAKDALHNYKLNGENKIKYKLLTEECATTKEKYEEAVGVHDEWKATKVKEAQLEKLKADKEAQMEKLKNLQKLEEEQKVEEK